MCAFLHVVEAVDGASREQYLRVGLVLVWLVMGILMVRAFVIQVASELSRERAFRYVLQRKTLTPPRGNIYDRNGILVAGNQTGYDVCIVAGHFDTSRIGYVARLLGLSPSFMREKLAEAWRHSPWLPYPIVKGVTSRELVLFQEKLSVVEGVELVPRHMRFYPYGAVASHVIGFVGEVSPAQLAADSFYQPGDFVGQYGIELKYERVLRGKKGFSLVMVDALGRNRGAYRGGELDVAAVAGAPLRLTIDLKLQQVAEWLLNGTRGSVVMLDPYSGEVLALASSPSFSLDSLVGLTRSWYFRRLVMDTLKPLYNRAIMGLYPPGSTFKPFLAIYVLERGVVSREFGWVCGGGWSRRGLYVGCHAHPPAYNIERAIQYSCNSYFSEVFLRAVGAFPASALDSLSAFVRLLGLTVPSGIDLPGEQEGFFPGGAYYDRVYGAGRWSGMTVISLGIGQAELLVTAVQLAVAMAVIANGGFRVVPYVVKQVGTQPRFSQVEAVPVSQEVLALLRGALRAAVKEGTAQLSEFQAVALAGKTGTAENPHGEDHSLFVGFAPADAPRVVIAVVVENRGFGARWAAPIASLLAEYYLRGQISAEREWLLSLLGKSRHELDSVLKPYL